MKVRESAIKSVPLLAVDGDLDHSSKQAVLDVIDGIFRGPYPPQSLLFDLSECAFVDSGGLSVLLSTLTRLPAEGWLGLIGVASGPGRVLTYTGFLNLERVRFFSSLEEAEASLSWERELTRARRSRAGRARSPH
jgi:anti-anti-sigma factor